MKVLSLLLLGLSSRALSQVLDEAAQVNDEGRAPSWGNQLQRQTKAAASIIPPEAHGAYCTAIMGWYNGNCSDPGRDPAIGTTFCDDSTFEKLPSPLWIDLNHCYANPNLKGRAVTFFGETPDQKKIMEFHMIFKSFNLDDIPNKYQGVNCDINGSCECPRALLDLKQRFLQEQSCDDTDEYSCISENFYGDNDQCFVPSTFKYADGKHNIWCSMMAEVVQAAGCDTQLGIPDSAYLSNCTGITGWYDSCSESSINDDDDIAGCSTGFTHLAEPLFIDLDNCFANPYLNQRSVTFYGRAPDGIIKEFHLIFKSDNFGDFRPMNCTDEGMCQCSPALRILKEELTSKGGCDDLNADVYACESGDFYGATDRCYIPATWEGDDGKFYCSMVARIESFEPCDESLISSNLTAPTKTPTSIPVVGPEPTSPPGPEPTSLQPTTNPTAPSPTPAVPEPTSIPASETPVPPTKAPNTTIFAPSQAPSPLIPRSGSTFNTAIVGWWNECSSPDTDDGSYCAGGSKVEIADGPIYIDFNTCYSNPNFPGRSVSFFTPDDRGDLLSFHLVFTKRNTFEAYSPKSCRDGVCGCNEPTSLGALRNQMVDEKKCFSDAIDGIICITETSKGIKDECYVPLVEGISTDEGNRLLCAMVAEVQTVPRGQTSPASSSNSGADAAGTAMISILGGILVVGAFMVVAFAFLKIRRMQARRRFDHADANVDEDEVEWVRRDSHNPQYSTSHQHRIDEPDGLFKHGNVGITRRIDDDFSIS